LVIDGVILYFYFNEYRFVYFFTIYFQLFKAETINWNQ